MKNLLSYLHKLISVVHFIIIIIIRKKYTYPLKLLLNWQCPPKLSIVSMFHLKLPKHAIVPHKTNRNTKTPLDFFQSDKNVFINSKKKLKLKN
jgi:hypothetical protein